MTLDKRAIDSAKTDAQAFQLTRTVERRAFIERLANDPLTQAFSPVIVKWLLDTLKDEAAARARALDDRYTRQQRQNDETLAEAAQLRALSLATSKHVGFLYTCESTDDGSKRQAWHPTEYANPFELFPGCDDADAIEFEAVYTNRAPVEKPKGKAIRQLAKVVAEQAEFIAQFDHIIEHIGDTPEDTYDALVAFSLKHAHLISECKS